MPAEIVAAADGSSLSNPGPAGWAWYIDDDHWAAGGWEHGTNNMAELMAVLNLLESTVDDPRRLRILCDSQYVINSLTKWLPGWKRRGWKKGDGKPVLNVELMKALDEALRGREVQFEWVKGHAGHRLNEAADLRARRAAEAFQAGRRPDPGPGFRGAVLEAAEARFSVGQSDPEPDLFSLGEPAPQPPATPGTASPRVKAVLLNHTRQLLDSRTRADVAKLAELLHPEFVAHTVRGVERVLDDGPWSPTTSEFEVLAVDAYGDDVAGMRWRHDGNLRFSLWQRTPTGWRMRFAQVTPGE
ncbi:ribonuclease HI family protein [Tessaracoccus oleiagri]|uniref:Ribonuclease H n=1 Tax=Tessaracoccus oleiagri TaxID=686624 RepID=A0A1G9JJW1_9ACTN|nr:ribonuclease HI family protein [Tessaracoccus oleiagri]SDL37867.1 ribonuclease HI [Tessaracoccus oleiagri]